MRRHRFSSLSAAIASLVLVVGCGSSQDEAGDRSGPRPGPENSVGQVEDSEIIDASGLDGTRMPERKASAEPSALDQCIDPIHVTGAITDGRGMASAARAREALELARTPSPAMILPRDFTNYYRVLPPADATSDPSIVLQIKKRSFGLPTDPVFQFDLLVALVAKPLANPRPLALVLVVDTTPSMQGIALGRAQAVIDAVATGVRLGDHVSVLTTEPGSTALFDQAIASDTDRESLRGVPALLEPGSEAKAADAVSRAYDIAEEQRDRNHDARVVLLGDGDGEIGDLDRSRIEADAQPGENPILLIAAGTGSSSGYRTRFMRVASRAGRGAYLYVDGAQTAKELFVDRLDEITRIAKDKVTLDLTVQDFHVTSDIEESLEQTDVETAEQAAQYLVPGKSMNFLFRLVPCGGAFNTSANLDVTFNFADGSPVHVIKTIDEINALGDTAALDKAVAIDAYAKALRSLTSRRLVSAQDLIAEALTTNAGDADLEQIDALLAKHPLLAP